MASDNPTRRGVPLTSPGAWVQLAPRAAITKPVPRHTSKHTMFVVLASGHTLSAAGMHGKGVKVLDFGDFAELVADAGDPFDVATRELIGQIRLSAIESLEELSPENLRDQTMRFSIALGAVGRLGPEKIFEAVQQQLEAAAAHSRESTESLYQVLSAQEMADLMECSVPVIYQREAANEFFSALAPGRRNGKRFPAFLIDAKLDRPLMKRIIEAYKAARVGTTLLWSFLRAPQNEFGGRTAVQMLLGGAAPAYAGMKREQRAAAIMDVVDEELSRVRLTVP